MLRRGLVRPGALRAAFEAIEPQFHRYPALDRAGFRRALDELLERAEQDSGPAR